MIGICVVLAGCASFQFPKLGGAPERPSLKSSWKETHSREPIMVGPGAVVYKTVDEFQVGHEDSRPVRKNILQRIIGFVASFGALAILYFYLPAGALAAVVIAFVRRALLWRKALFQTINGIDDAVKKDETIIKPGTPLHTALEGHQDKPTKDFIDLVRNKP